MIAEKDCPKISDDAMEWKQLTLEKAQIPTSCILATKSSSSVDQSAKDLVFLEDGLAVSLMDSQD